MSEFEKYKGDPNLNEKMIKIDGVPQDLGDLLTESIQLLREHEPEDGYYGCFSGGKDSIAVREVARIAGVRVEWHYHATTIDPPEVVRFIRAQGDVTWDKPRHGNFFHRVVQKKQMPTRRCRWCCQEYKEIRPACRRSMLLGIRREESPRRAARWPTPVVHRYAGPRTAIVPLLEWPTEELWDFIRCQQLKVPSLYAEGWHRLGCVGCPLSSEKNRLRELSRWPGFERNWKRACRKVWEAKTGCTQKNGRAWFGDAYFRRWEDFWHWWVHDVSLDDARTRPASARL